MRRAVRSFAAPAAVAALLVLAAPAHAVGTWTMQATTGTAQPLFGAACADVQHCWAVGKTGAIVATTDAGATWPVQASGLTTQQLNGVACPSSSVCYAGGNAGTLLKTANGGTNWSAQTSNVAKHLNAVSCVDATHCVAAGQVNG